MTDLSKYAEYGPKGTVFKHPVAPNIVDIPIDDRRDLFEKAKDKDTNIVKYAMFDTYFARGDESKPLGNKFNTVTVDGVQMVACVNFVAGFGWGTVGKNTLTVVGDHIKDENKKSVLGKKYPVINELATMVNEKQILEYAYVYSKNDSTLEFKEQRYSVKQFNTGQQNMTVAEYYKKIGVDNKSLEDKVIEFINNELTLNNSGPMFTATLDDFLSVIFNRKKDIQELLKQLGKYGNITDRMRAITNEFKKTNDTSGKKEEVVKSMFAQFVDKGLSDEDKNFVLAVSTFKRRMTNLLGMFSLEHVIRHGVRLIWVPADLLIRPCFNYNENSNKCLPFVSANSNKVQLELNKLLQKFPVYMGSDKFVDYELPKTADWTKTYYPFTRLGYTYDVGGMVEGDINGLPEYILVLGTPIKHIGGYWMEEFIDLLLSGEDKIKNILVQSGGCGCSAGRKPDDLPELGQRGQIGCCGCSASIKKPNNQPPELGQRGCCGCSASRKPDEFAQRGCCGCSAGIRKPGDQNDGYTKRYRLKYSGK